MSRTCRSPRKLLPARGCRLDADLLRRLYFGTYVPRSRDGYLGLLTIHVVHILMTDYLHSIRREGNLSPWDYSISWSAARLTRYSPCRNGTRIEGICTLYFASAPPKYCADTTPMFLPAPPSTLSTFVTQVNSFRPPSTHTTRIPTYVIPQESWLRETPSALSD